jgi:hypothetical protein
MRTVLAIALAFALSVVPTFAQSPQSGSTQVDVKFAQSIERATRVEAARAVHAASQPAQDDAYRPGGMSPAYFWTGVGLMAAGGSTLVTGALIGSTDSGVCADLDVDCSTLSKGMIAIGAGMIAAGGVVYVIGKNKARQSSPQIVAGPSLVLVRTRVTF